MKTPEVSKNQIDKKKIGLFSDFVKESQDSINGQTLIVDKVCCLTTNSTLLLDYLTRFFQLDYLPGKAPWLTLECWRIVTRSFAAL